MINKNRKRAGLNDRLLIFPVHIESHQGKGH
jgi:hypothetical protein